jgi:hypothetical protein
MVKEEHTLAVATSFSCSSNASYTHGTRSPKSSIRVTVSIGTFGVCTALRRASLHCAWLYDDCEVDGDAGDVRCCVCVRVRCEYVYVCVCEHACASVEHALAAQVTKWAHVCALPQHSIPHTHTHTHARARTHTNTHTHTGTHTHRERERDPETQTQTHTDTQTHRHTQTQTQTQTHTHRHRHRHRHRNTHTHTHTHHTHNTYPPSTHPSTRASIP